MPIDRTNITVIDDDGSLTFGTPFEDAWAQLVFDAIDDALHKVVTLTDGATPALDASLGTTFRLVAAGDRTIAVPSNPTSAQCIRIQHKASGGSRTLSLNTGAGGFRFGSDITGLTATSSGKTDYIDAEYNAADGFWDVVLYRKGY